MASARRCGSSADVEEGVAARERAFEEYARAGRCDAAARVAVWVSHQYLILGQVLGGARLAVAGGAGAGGLRRVRGPRLGGGRARPHAEDAEECARHARRAMAIARDCADPDLEVFALSLLGRAEVSAGRRAEGMALLEEAMAAAAAGRVRNLHTLGEAYCNLVDRVHRRGRVGARGRVVRARRRVRAHERPRAAARRLPHGPRRRPARDRPLDRGRARPGERARHATPATSPAWSRRPSPRWPSSASARAGWPRPSVCWRAARSTPSSLRALALLRIAEGRAQTAAALLERGLAGAEGPMHATQLLAPLVDARLAAGDHGRRRRRSPRADRAGALVRDRPRPRACRPRRRARRARDARSIPRRRPSSDDPRADEAARRALVGFGALGMPLDAGEARLALARALAGDAPELAREEARAALAAFRELGASRAMSAAAAVLRDLGEATGARPRGLGELTAREQEVLGLLALGMTNARIAETLVISEKTAGHHVSRVLEEAGRRQPDRGGGPGGPAAPYLGEIGNAPDLSGAVRP